MIKQILIVTALTTGMLGVAAAAAPPTAAVEHFTATAVEMTSFMRVNLRPMEIVVTRWSSEIEHQILVNTLLEKGPIAFLDRLCTFAPAGAIIVVGGREFTVRYAWQAWGYDGTRRIYLGFDEPMSLNAVRYRPRGEPLTFLELRIGRNGLGKAKFSDALRLSVDQTRNLIGLRDYDLRPLDLIEVRSQMPFDE
jgi:hypothetical protein